MAKVWDMYMDFLMSLISISKLRKFTSISKLGLGDRETERRMTPEPKLLLVILVRITSLTAL